MGLGNELVISCDAGIEFRQFVLSESKKVWVLLVAPAIGLDDSGWFGSIFFLRECVAGSGLD